MPYKIKSVSLKNFANYDDVFVSFDPNTTYLVGKNGSGKSTIGITAIWYIFQSVAEKASNGTTPLIGERFRFIGPKGATAKGELVLLDEKSGVEIKVIRKLTKTGSELSFNAPDGMELSQQWLNDLFNVFMISPKVFTELSGVQQAKAIGIDTSKYDAKIVELKEKAKTTRVELKQYDNLVSVEEAKEVNLQELQDKKQEVRDRLNTQFRENKKHNDGIREQWENAKKRIDDDVKEHNLKQHNLVEQFNQCQLAHQTLMNAGYVGKSVADFLNSLNTEIKDPRVAANEYPAAPTDLSIMPDDYVPAEGEVVLIKEMPDDKELKELDQQILDATATNTKALLYSQYLEKKAAKEKKEKELADNAQVQKTEADNRIKYIQSLKLPFSNLTVDEDGQLLLKDKTQNFKPIKEPYFSTGEILKIVPMLVAHSKPELKYVFVQGYRDLDEENWAQVEKYLLDNGFQIVVEVVSKEKIVGKNCILLKDNCIVEDYNQEEAPKLM